MQARPGLSEEHWTAQPTVYGNGDRDLYRRGQHEGGHGKRQVERPLCDSGGRHYRWIRVDATSMTWSMSVLVRAEPLGSVIPEAKRVSDTPPANIWLLA